MPDQTQPNIDLSFLNDSDDELPLEAPVLVRQAGYHKERFVEQRLLRLEQEVVELKHQINNLIEYQAQYGQRYGYRRA